MQPTFQPNTQYEKYRAPLKKQCLIDAIASAMAIVTIIFLLFIPNFSIDLSSKSILNMEGTTLPKLYALDLSVLPEQHPQLSFSVYDEIYAIIAPLQSDDVTTMAIGMSFGLFQLLGLAFLAVAFVMCIVSVTKGVLHLVKPDNYALEMYDKIKQRTTEKRSRAYLVSPMYWAITGIVYELIAIFFASFMGRISGSGTYLTSYFPIMTGITAGCVFTILFCLATLALFIVSKYLLKKIRFSVMKEDYGVGTPSPAVQQTVPNVPQADAPAPAEPPAVQQAQPAPQPPQPPTEPPQGT